LKDTSGNTSIDTVRNKKSEIINKKQEIENQEQVASEPVVLPKFVTEINTKYGKPTGDDKKEHAMNFYQHISQEKKEKTAKETKWEDANKLLIDPTWE
jgi:hypothetical protein